MSISFPAGNSNPSASNVSVTTIACSNQTIVALAANTARLAGAMIVNNTPSVVWLQLSQGAVTAGAANSIPLQSNGGNYDIPESYKGIVQAIAETANTGSLQIVEPRA